MQYALVLFGGLSWGMTVFLAAAGLTLIFGILHILNFAHGGFVMLGAYVAYSLLSPMGSPSLPAFFGAVVAGAVVLGLLGAGVDKLVFTRLRSVNDSYSLIATYALLLLCEGGVKLVWGVDTLSLPPPPELGGAFVIAGLYIPKFVLFVLACGVVVFLLLDYVVHRTTIGKTMQSVAVDRWMTGLLGINERVVLVAIVVAGVALAGLAGAILSINQGLSPTMGSTVIIQAFGVVIVGGMGNIRGAFLASILLGIVTAFGDLFVAAIPGLFFYIALICILMWRPQGLIKGLH